MDDGAIVTNIATILAKDLLLDRAQKFRPMPYPMQQFREFLDDSGDDGLDIYMYNMLRKKRVRTFENGGAAATGGRCSSSSSQSSSESRSPPPDSNKITKSSPPARESGDSQEVNLHVSHYLPPKEFEANFHMKKCTYNALLEVIGPLMKNQQRQIGDSLISKDTFFSLALWKLSTSQHYEEISQRFKIPASVCQRVATNFSDLISDFYSTFINWPKQQHIAAFTEQKETQMLGVIGTKQLEVFLESEDDEVGVTLQLVCTSDMIIIDCYLELAESYSFERSPLWMRLQSKEESLPGGIYLVGNGTLPLKPFIMTPYTNAESPKKIRFNQYIDDQLKIAQETIKQTMHRYQSLYSLEAKDLTEMRNTVQTICCLHNFCRRFNDDCIPKLQDSEVEDDGRKGGSETDPSGLKRREQLLQTLFS